VLILLDGSRLSIVGALRRCHNSRCRVNMGEFFALCSAVVWATAVILFKRSGETVSPFALNLFRVVISSILLVLTLLVLGEPFWNKAPLQDYLVLFISGIIAIAMSDTFFHLCLNMVGAGITAIVDCLYSPFVVLIAFFLIGERLGPWQIVGMVLIVMGVFVAARHKPPAGTTHRRLAAGIVWGVLAMATLALGIVIAKPVLNRSPVLWATAMRQIGCLIVMIPIAVISTRRREFLSVFRPTRMWKYSLSGTIVGSYLALILWIAGMKYTMAGTAAILNQTTTIYILIFASIFLKEPFTVRKLISAILAVAGILMVTLD
jgi:drug/metabolite transporter (DMT)-like permease